MADDRIQLTTAKPAVLFVCVHNAGRSQMGAGWLSHLAGDQVDVFSGGTDPGLGLNVRERVETLMSSLGLDVAATAGQR